MAWNDNLRLEGYADVCSVLELKGLGERWPTATEGMAGGIASNHAENLDEFKKVLRTKVQLWDNQYISYPTKSLWSSKKVERVALIVSYASSYQPVAIGYLEALGFNSSGPVKKLKHPDSDLTLFWITPEEFLKAIEYKEE